MLQCIHRIVTTHTYLSTFSLEKTIATWRLTIKEEQSSTETLHGTAVSSDQHQKVLHFTSFRGVFLTTEVDLHLTFNGLSGICAYVVFFIYPQRHLCHQYYPLSLGVTLCPLWRQRLVEEANDLAGDVLATGLLVVHDTSGGGQDHVAELTGRQQADGPLLQVGKLDVVARRDNTGLVQTIKQKVG